MLYKCLLICLIPFSVFCQFDFNNNIDFLNTKTGIYYLNSNSNCNYIIKFNGDSIKQAENSSFFEIDGRMISITDYSFSCQDFSNKDKNDELKKLLLNKLELEKEYIENEVYNLKIKVDKEYFTNNENKQFLLWGFEIPKKKIKKIMKDLDLVESPVYNSFLFFVSNGVVVGVYIPSINQENIIHDKNYLKQISENIDVFGGQINKEAFYYKIEAENQNTPFTYIDSLNNYSIEIPQWFNVCQTTPIETFGGTLPDINNNCNAIFILPTQKTKFNSFNEFNEYHILRNVPGQKALFNENLIWMGYTEQEKPNNCNGISYRIFYFSNNNLYKCWFITYESSSAYLLIQFISTEDTFELNREKFNEFLSRIKIF